MRLVCLENPEIFVKLDFEFAKDYPKVPLKVNVVDVQPENPKLSKDLTNIVTFVPRSNLGSECVHEITGRIDELLNSTAISRAAKENPFSLEEERANREAAARLAAQQREDLVKEQQQQEAAKTEQALAQRLESERKRREQAATATSDDMLPDYELSKSDHRVAFDQTMKVLDRLTSKDITFKTVDGRLMITRRDDKLMVVVTPSITDESQNPPQLLLKKIFLPQNLAPKESLQRTMRHIEDLLEVSRTQHQTNIVDLLGYKIIHPTTDDDNWELDILSEWAMEGSLDNLLQLSGPLTPSKVKDWSMQLLEALHFFDQHGFVHPAVHASNVLIFRSSSGSVTIKLSDGYGTALRDFVEKARGTKPPRPEDQHYWIAPEVNLDISKRTAQTCIWDLGTVILQMALGTDVFKHFTAPDDCLKREPFPLHFRNLLTPLFHDKPEKRPTAFKLKAYQFFFERDPMLFQRDDFGRSRRGIKGAPETSTKWLSDWEVTDKLGKGGQGMVVKARNINDQGIYAVKIITAKGSEVLTQVRQEVLLLKDLKHPSIVRYYSAWTEQDQGEGTATPTTSDTQSYNEGAAAFRDSRRAPTTPGRTMTLEEDDFILQSQFPTGPELESADNLFRGSGAGGFFAKPKAGDSDDDSAGYDNAFGQAPAPAMPDEDNDEEDAPSDPESGAAPDEGNLFGTGDKEDNQNESRQHKEEVERALEEAKTSTMYIQMEYCDQNTLRQMINNLDLPSKLDDMWRIFRSILDGLKYIHEQGITHRDLKPENIFLDSDNNPKIGDFGLATAAFAARGSGNVGTTFYIPPELKHALKRKDLEAGTLGSKVDMYSLGIMLFEMNFPLATGTERIEVLGDLNRAQHSLPARFAAESYLIQGRIILELINHDPKERPDASELLSRPDIPEPIEDEKLRRRLFWMMEKEPDKMLSWLKGRSNDEVLDLSWEYRGEDDNLMDPVTVDFVTSELRNIFHRHGAVSTARQGLFPKAPQYDNPVTFLGHDGLILQLPHDLTMPFSRAIAHKYPGYSKCYSIDTVFRTRQDRAQGDEPRYLHEVDFDVVSSKTTDLPLKDATVLLVLDDIIRTFPALDSTSWVILLNHNDLIDLILRFCSIKATDFPKVKKQLATLYSKGVTAEKVRDQWESIRSTLRSKAFNIHETSVSSLSKFIHIFGSPDDVRTQLSKLLGKQDLITEAVTTLGRLGEILKHTSRLRLKTAVFIAPLSSNSDGIYPGNVMFQCVHRKSGALAAGGRYDNLIRHHQRGMNAPVTARAVGFRLSLGPIVHRLLAAGPNKLSKTASRDQSTALLAPSSVASRVDVLVTSFDAASLTTAGLDCLSLLLGGGISAELTEEVETMEEIEEQYTRDAPYWLVIVKGGALAEEGRVKVRTPQREEVEVVVKELVGWLGREMGRKGKGRK